MILAVQLERIRDYLPTMSGHIVTANVRYRYNQEANYRQKTMTLWIPGHTHAYLMKFGDPTTRSTLESAEWRMKNWHWTDKAGTLRRVILNDMQVDILNIEDDECRQAVNLSHLLSFRNLVRLGIAPETQD